RALHAVVEPPAQLRDRIGHARRRDDRLADEPSFPRRAEVGEPLVVRAHAGELELAVVGIRARARERDAGIEHLRPDAVGVEVLDARLRVEAARTDLLVAISLGPELEVGEPRRRRETEGTEALAVVERPDVALLGAQHLRRARAEPLRHARLPQIGRLVHVRVGVENRVVDARDVVEDVRHARSIARLLAHGQGMRARWPGRVARASVTREYWRRPPEVLRY